MTDIEFACKAEFAETEKTLRSELAGVLAKSTLDVVNNANNNITQQQYVMAEQLRQLESAAEARVQSDAVAARMALANAEQIMSHENVKELNRVMELHHQTFNRKKLFMKKCSNASAKRGNSFSTYRCSTRLESKKSPFNKPNLLLVPPPSRQLVAFVSEKDRFS